MVKSYRAVSPTNEGGVKLPIQPWMTAPGVTAIFDALSEGSVRFVGGCVRDAILNRPQKDVDLATDLRPEAVMSAAADAGLKAIATGIEHGTVTIVAKKQSVEVTTLRKDVETDGRRAVVAFTEDWREDAVRRDLTFNALSMDRDGTIHDYFDGYADAQAGRVRFVGDAIARIREDALRILRFFRFYAHYGRGEPDAEGVAACREQADLLQILSAERVQQEILRLLGAKNPLPAVDLMANNGVWGALDFPATDIGALRALVADPDAEPDALLRLAALAGRSEGAKSIAEILRLSNDHKARLEVLQNLSFGNPPSQADHGGLLYRYGSSLCADAASLAVARGGAPDSWGALQRAAEDWLPVLFPLQGKDLLAAGMEQGPEVGQVLRQVEDWWIGQQFGPDRAACLHKAETVKRLNSQS